MTPIAASKALDVLCRAWSDYEKTAQCEQTKRTEIHAWRDVKLAELKNRSHVLEIYLTNTFRERALIIREMFARLDDGIERSNDILIGASIRGIVDIARESPLKEVHRIMSDLGDPSVKMIDI